LKIGMPISALYILSFLHFTLDPNILARKVRQMKIFLKKMNVCWNKLGIIAVKQKPTANNSNRIFEPPFNYRLL
jgi:hypothetical protein